MLKTRRNLKSGLVMLLAFILICSTLLFILDVPSLAAANDSDDNSEVTGLADDGHDHDSEGENEGNTEKEKSAFRKWWDSYNQIIGYIVAGIIFIAIVVTIILWIPKDDKKVKNKKK